MSSDAVRKAVKKYDSENTVFIGLKLNRKTDADIIKRLEIESNKQGYIKQAIRNDMNK